VVVVNYRRWDDTVALLRPLLAGRAARRGAAEVVIVDNHSPAHPALPRLRRRAGVSLRRWGRNRGFAQAANEGCRLSRADWLLLLNPDMTLPAEGLDRILTLAERWQAVEPRAGIIGLRLCNPDGTHQLSTGPFPTLAGTLLRLVLPRARRKYSPGGGDRRRPVPWVSGCCLLIRRECFAQLGGFDRDFFLYYEDVDLCRRAWQQGWSVWYEPGASLTHHRPLHVRTVPAHLRVITRHALLTYADKHWPRWQLRTLAAIVRLEARARQWFARRHGDDAAAGLFGELRRIAADLGNGRRRSARRRLRAIVQREEERRAAPPVDHHPQSQPPRPAAGLPRQRAPACAAGDRGRGG
jgi:GT2 family glycosyltransferase